MRPELSEMWHQALGRGRGATVEPEADLELQVPVLIPKGKHTQQDNVNPGMPFDSSPPCPGTSNVIQPESNAPTNRYIEGWRLYCLTFGSVLLDPSR